MNSYVCERCSVLNWTEWDMIITFSIRTVVTGAFFFPSRFVSNWGFVDLTFFPLLSTEQFCPSSMAWFCLLSPSSLESEWLLFYCQPWYILSTHLVSLLCLLNWHTCRYYISAYIYIVIQSSIHHENVHSSLYTLYLCTFWKRMAGQILCKFKYSGTSDISFAYFAFFVFLAVLNVLVLC